MIRTDYDAKGRPIAENYEDHLIESLKDPEYAKAYLNAALEDDDYRVFLLAMRDVANAFGITKLANDADLNRENIYKMLSPKGNPKISSVVAILRAIGVRLKTVLDEASNAVAPPLEVLPDVSHGNWLVSTSLFFDRVYSFSSWTAEKHLSLNLEAATAIDRPAIIISGGPIVEIDEGLVALPREIAVAEKAPSAAANQELALAA